MVLMIGKNVIFDRVVGVKNKQKQSLRINENYFKYQMNKIIMKMNAKSAYQLEYKQRLQEKWL